ncbi:hypothetical protein IWZ03DRAFT_369391 [Phyllosticta citriasiana]|uniref:Uncharacterized protein n=1 Tax=Phyllosticta citriasiana TaxID=595635 RepID=A0ABR1KVU6_9PEZI
MPAPRGAHRSPAALPSCCLLDAAHREPTVRQFRKVLAPKVHLRAWLAGWLAAAPLSIPSTSHAMTDRPVCSHDSPTHPPPPARRRCTSCHWPRRVSTYLSCAVVTMRSVLPRRPAQSSFARLSDSFTLSRCLLFRRPRRHPARPSPGTALGQAAATTVARTRRRLQGNDATTSSPHDTLVLTLCQAATRNFFSITLPLLVTGMALLHPRLRFFENKSQKHDEACCPQNVVIRPASWK